MGQSYSVMMVSLFHIRNILAHNVSKTKLHQPNKSAEFGPKE